MFPTHGIHRGRRVELDARNTEILAERMRLLDAVTGPRVGDFVRLPGGVLHRFSYRFDDALQTSAGGSWYLGDGWCSFSGTLDPSIPLGEIAPANEIMGGEVWFFDHNWAEAHNGIYLTVPFRVYEVTNPKYTRKP